MYISKMVMPQFQAAISATTDEVSPSRRYLAYSKQEELACPLNQYHF
jgi:hypothetical protein